MTVVTDSSVDLFRHRVSVDGYQYADSSEAFYLGAYKYFGNIASSVLSSTLADYNIAFSFYSYSLTTLTLGPTDTLYIPGQTSIYSSPLGRIPFPATYGSTWQSSYHFDVNYELSYAAFSLLHEPGTKRTYTERSDTVKGWGKMRVKDASGLPSLWFDVLQVQTTEIRTDSFFLNGVPPPLALLSALSIIQGKTDTFYTQYYYRKREVRPLATVTYTDASFTHPVKAIIHRQRLTTGVPVIDELPAILVYPNPARNKHVHVHLPRPHQDYYYTLMSISGQQIASGSLSSSVIDVSVPLPEFIGSGIYIMAIIQGSELICSKHLVVSE
jgi:hypothetical protein